MCNTGDKYFTYAPYKMAHPYSMGSTVNMGRVVYKVNMVLQFTDMKKANNKTKQDFEHFYRNPDEYIPVDEIGDMYLNWFFERYAAIRMMKNLPIFKKAYRTLTKRGNFSREDAFGEMHCDGYLWIEKHPTVKVIIEERQSFKYIYMYDGFHFHIRALDYAYNYPDHRKRELKGITIEKFRKQDFAPHCPEKISERFDAFSYGDRRDDGYILSMDCYMKGFEKVDSPDMRTISAITNLEYWVHYLDDPSELE